MCQKFIISHLNFWSKSFTSSTLLPETLLTQQSITRQGYQLMVGSQTCCHNPVNHSEDLEASTR